MVEIFVQLQTGIWYKFDLSKIKSEKSVEDIAFQELNRQCHRGSLQNHIPWSQHFFEMINTNEKMLDNVRRKIP